MKSIIFLISTFLLVGASRVQPPFDITKNQTDRLLDIASWLGSVRDWSHTAVIFTGLGLQPTPKDLEMAPKGYALFFRELWPDSKASISYSVDKKDKRDNIIAAFQVVVNDDKACITYNILSKRFGSPYSRVTASDAAGVSYTWEIGKSKRFHDYLNTSPINDQDQCMYSLTFLQSIKPLSNNTM